MAAGTVVLNESLRSLARLKVVTWACAMYEGMDLVAYKHFYLFPYLRTTGVSNDWLPSKRLYTSMCM